MLNTVKVGDLVKMIHGFSIPGIVMNVDIDHFGRGLAAAALLGTHAGKRDRVLVLWPDQGYTYEESNKLEIINEGR